MGYKAHDAVEALDAAVVDAQPEGGEDAVAVLADGAGGLDERGQSAAAGPGDPPVDELGDAIETQVG